MKSKLEQAQKRLEKHRRDSAKHFRSASEFLVKCQITEPYVQEGTLRGCVCPWEIGTADRKGFTILEDFHDTLEAIWVWSCYTRLSGKDTYRHNIEKSWQYVAANWKRFLPSDRQEEGMYDCSHLILAGSIYEEVFADKHYHKLLHFGGNKLARYLSSLRSTKGRGYFDSWWMVACLSLGAHLLKRRKWLEVATRFVERNLIEKAFPFSEVEKEPWHRGPGGHNFFSVNANKVLALLSCFPTEAFTKEMTIKKFLPLAPRQFVKRHADENPWNANVAAALGKSYLMTGEEKFLQRYFAVMDELRARAQNSALYRSEKFPVKESWVTFFFAYAYAAVI